MRHESNCDCKSCDMDFEAMLLQKREGREVEKPFNMPVNEYGKKGGFIPQSDYARVMEIATQLDRDYERLKDALVIYQKALEDIIDVRLEPAYCYEQSAFMQNVAIKALDKVLVPTKRRAASCTAKKD